MRPNSPFHVIACFQGSVQIILSVILRPARSVNPSLPPPTLTLVSSIIHQTSSLISSFILQNSAFKLQPSVYPVVAQRQIDRTAQIPFMSTFYSSFLWNAHYLILFQRKHDKCSFQHILKYAFIFFTDSSTGSKSLGYSAIWFILPQKSSILTSSNVYFGFSFTTSS